MEFALRRLRPSDALAFRELRLEGFERHSFDFRVAVEDEFDWPLERHAAQLERDYLLGAWADTELVGLAGFSRFAGRKLEHRGLLYGMYIRETARGLGLADRLVLGIIEHARTQVETLLLTVVSENTRAQRLYERHGFCSYGLEAQAVKQGERCLDELLMRRQLEPQKRATGE